MVLLGSSKMQLKSDGTKALQGLGSKQHCPKNDPEFRKPPIDRFGRRYQESHLEIISRQSGLVFVLPKTHGFAVICDPRLSGLCLKGFACKKIYSIEVFNLFFGIYHLGKWERLVCVPNYDSISKGFRQQQQKIL